MGGRAPERPGAPAAVRLRSRVLRERSRTFELRSRAFEERSRGFRLLSWFFEVGSWVFEVGSWVFQMGSWIFQVGSWKSQLTVRELQRGPITARQRGRSRCVGKLCKLRGAGNTRLRGFPALRSISEA